MAADTAVTPLRIVLAKVGLDPAGVKIIIDEMARLGVTEAGGLVGNFTGESEFLEAARQAATVMLADNERCAGGPDVQVDLATFTPGAVVTATIRCRTAHTGVELVTQTDETYTATATAVIDTYRSAGAP